MSEPQNIDEALVALKAAFFETKALKNWATLVTRMLDGFTPTPEPTPPVPDPVPVPDPPAPDPTPAPTADVDWLDPDAVLDQGDTGHCVGFGCAQFGNVEPVTDHYTNDDGHALYYECKLIDKEPNQENGSSVRSGATALKDRERIEAYAFAANVEEVVTWLRTHGPVIIGSDWYDNMFDPDGDGYVFPIGSIAGGHCYVAVGDLASEGAILFQNSWGDSWGLSGRFKMKYADVRKLLDAQGEACAAVELPL